MRWVRRRDLGFALLDDGAVMVRAQAAGIGAKVPPVAVGVLAYFSQPRTAEEAARAFGPQAAQLVDGLIRVELLVSEEDAAESPVFFDNFASLDVHRRMLADTHRLDAYRRAIEELVEPEMAVMDAGTGTGVLAIFAARAGAERVVAVDNSEMVDQAREVVRDSGLAEVVQCVRSNFADVRTEPVDVVVTETFGALALAEGAAEDLARCIDRNLKDGGVVIPGEISLWFAPIVDAAALAPIRDPWEVEGADFGILSRAQELRGVTRAVDPAHLAGAGQCLARFSFPKDAVRQSGTVRFEGVDVIHGLCGWFTLHLSPSVELPTGPRDPHTHWQQVVLPLELECRGEVLELAIDVEPAAEDRRGLVVRARWSDGQREWRIR